MKQNRLKIQKICWIVAACGWWGALYPQLTLTPDTYKLVAEETGIEATQVQAVETTEEELEAVDAQWDFDRDIYEELFDTKEGKVRLRSKLLMKLKTCVDQYILWRDGNE